MPGEKPTPIVPETISLVSKTVATSQSATPKKVRTGSVATSITIPYSTSGPPNVNVSNMGKLRFLKISEFLLFMQFISLLGNEIYDDEAVSISNESISSETSITEESTIPTVISTSGINDSNNFNRFYKFIVFISKTSQVNSLYFLLDSQYQLVD